MKNSHLFAVAPGVWGLKDIFVNIYFVLDEDSQNWYLVDAGLKTSCTKIKKAASLLFPDKPIPAAILLTHAHFDHTGALKMLLKEWPVPVYAHTLEAPYLLGKSAYPPPDPTVGGGLMAGISFIYPSKPICIAEHYQPLPEGGYVPGLPDWQWLHTPGHAPGHVSFFRESDRVLLAGDAFVTTRQESVLAVITQQQVLSGPPKYFTYDWQEAKASVHKLANLEPEIAATGHGKPMTGQNMRRLLHSLAIHFDIDAAPAYGRYVPMAAVTTEQGVAWVPPITRREIIWRVAVVLAAVALTVYGTSRVKRPQNVT